MADNNNNRLSNVTEINKDQQVAMQQQWIQQQFQKANRHLAEKGIVPTKVLADESRYLFPYIALWKIEVAKPTKKVFWVLSGDLPCDFVDCSVAKNARDVLKHFSLHWQLKAEKLMHSGATKDPAQNEFAKLLINKAQGLYDLQDNDRLWQ